MLRYERLEVVYKALVALGKDPAFELAHESGPYVQHGMKSCFWNTLLGCYHCHTWGGVVRTYREEDVLDLIRWLAKGQN